MTARAWPTPSIPRPFRRAGSAALGPLVLTCEHASPELPPGLAAGGMASQILRTHWGWDIGAWDLAAAVARRLRASLVGGRVSRLFIDLNRPVGDPTLVVRAAGSVRLPWNGKLTPEALERRVGRYHVPYHMEIDRLVVRRLVRGVRPLLLAVHSFTGELHGRRREFDMGVLFDSHPLHAKRLQAALRREGLTVRANEPYSGIEGLMYSIHRHGTHHGLPCLELEVNQEILASAPRARALAPVVTRAIRHLMRFMG